MCAESVSSSLRKETPGRCIRHEWRLLEVGVVDDEPGLVVLPSAPLGIRLVFEDGKEVLERRGHWPLWFRLVRLCLGVEK